MSAIQISKLVAAHAALGALVLAGCGATPNRESAGRRDSSVPTGAAETAPVSSRPDPQESSAAADEQVAPESPGGGTVAIVAGQPVYASDLLSQWMHRDSNALRGQLENLVFSRLIVAEARRLGISLDAEMVQARYEDGLERLEQDLASKDPGLTVDRYIREELHLDPERYRRELARDLEVDLLAERCVRAWVLGCERAEVRVLVVDSRETVDAVETALESGGDFGALAREYSTHESKDFDGRIPPVVRSESGLARLAFATPVGQVGGPIFEEDSYLFLQVTGRPEPVEGDWSVLGPAVEASLLARPIEDPEYWQWKRAMQDTYEVDLTPLRELLDSVPTTRPSDAKN